MAQRLPPDAVIASDYTPSRCGNKTWAWRSRYRRLQRQLGLLNDRRRRLRLMLSHTEDSRDEILSSLKQALHRLAELENEP
jgi:hypothetical protein